MPRRRADAATLTVGEWMLTVFVLGIPVVNLVMYFAWAFSSAGNADRKNFCRATICWALIGMFVWGGFLLLAVGASVAAR